MNRRDRKKKSARRKAFRDPKKRFLVVCEGLVTEPDYLKGFSRWVKNPRVEVEIPKTHGVPLTVVSTAIDLKEENRRHAKREKDDNLLFDEVWCLHDVDEHPHLTEARQLAESNDIQVAISNPCFELWVLLHFREQPGAQHRKKLSRLVGEHLPEYEKALRFEELEKGYEDAVTRARRLDEQAEKRDEEGVNPSTGVYRLTEKIRQV
ncbi:RloB domain-containing protein [Bradymonadaceae bacterium TMQ3]|nr:RloB domain-containing protein [Bradymonadaceae bacterium TMQ3]TXC67859.1 RloB domain-containing protein [Bradymonadales bacterium TMQ1]